MVEDPQTVSFALILIFIAVLFARWYTDPVSRRNYELARRTDFSNS